MKYKDAAREFRSQFITLWLNEVDYWMAQEAWAAWTDGLCKDGQITEKQYMTWKTPFRYGKRLKLKVRYGT